MELNIIPVVLCGGSGSRLWPLSRSIHPKQLLSLIDTRSLLQNTLLRVSNLCSQTTPIIICNNEHRFLVADQILEAGLEKAHIFLEPEGRNTAPAITMAALHSIKKLEDPLLLIMPADHVIRNKDAFDAAIKIGAALAGEAQLVTFGVTPNKPETGYGYIERAEPFPMHAGFRVKQFIEKPSLKTAEAFLASGNHYWNSGIFLFRASVYMQALREFAPDILATCETVYAEMTKDLDFFRLGEKFKTVRDQSIDFAVMEKAKNIAVVPLTSDWSDVGSWDALWEIGPKDTKGNVIMGQVFTEEVSNSYLRAEKRLLAVVGLSDITVVETPDAILVANKKNCQAIKSIVTQLKSKNRSEANACSRVYRPWGHYETLNKAGNYHVKHIMVKPKAKLSLQSHQYRSEHWVIIKGIAKVTRGEDCMALKENESIYIPTNVKHRIENETDFPLELIEVQTGLYLEEDDITRFDDIYGRQEGL